MKKIVMACLGLFAVLTSCSDDDTSGANNSSPLVSTTQKIYNNGVLEEMFITEYDNGKVKKQKWLTPDNVQTGYSDLTYNNGLLASITNYTGTTLYDSTTYTYDSQQRMTGRNYSSPVEDIEYETVYTHNSNNTITAASTGYLTGTKTFYLNNDGNVYKEEIGEINYQIIYNGTTATTFINTGGNTMTYEYDNVHNPALININLGAGNFKANNILRSNRLADTVKTTADKYVIKETTAGYIWDYEYTFNDQGLPVKVMNHYNDQLMSEIEYSYE
jgi:hypothetical protein